MHYHREERDDFVRHLATQFPKCFFEQPELRRPLKRNITDDLEERKVLNRDKCLAAVNRYESSFTYCYGIIAGAERVDLDGRVVGKVTEQEQEKTRK
jgi:ProP effector